MYSEMFGVNIMRVRSVRVASIIVLLFFLGCSGDKQSAKPDAKKDSTEASTKHKTELAKIPEGASLEDTIEFVMNEAITRLKYGDKSGLYENEFQYYTDEHNLDDFLKSGPAMYAKADTVSHIDVISVQRYPADSAVVAVEVMFEGKTGTTSMLRDTVSVYYSGGRWKKPTASHITPQLEYEKLVKQAQQDAGK